MLLNISTTRYASILSLLGLVISLGLTSCKNEMPIEIIIGDRSSVRFVNLLPNSSKLLVTVEGEKKFLSLSSSSVSRFETVIAGSPLVTVINSLTSDTVISSREQFRTGKKHTAILMGSANDALLLTSDCTLITDPTKANVKFVFACNPSQPIDLRNGRDSEPFSDIVFGGIEERGISLDKGIEAGSYRFVLTRKDQADNVLARFPTMTFEKGKNYTLICYGVNPTPFEFVGNLRLLVDGEEESAFTEVASEARTASVIFFNGSSEEPAVSVSANGTTLSDNLEFDRSIPYTNIPAGVVSMEWKSKRNNAILSNQQIELQSNKRYSFFFVGTEETKFYSKEDVFPALTSGKALIRFVTISNSARANLKLDGALFFEDQNTYSVSPFKEISAGKHSMTSSNEDGQNTLIPNFDFLDGHIYQVILRGNKTVSSELGLGLKVVTMK